VNEPAPVPAPEEPPGSDSDSGFEPRPYPTLRYTKHFKYRPSLNCGLTG
jgi:hypothetical protein